jgi:drug/metabolite transporter (DMT)-like permease
MSNNSGIIKKDSSTKIDFSLVLAVCLAIVAWASAFAGIRVGLRSYSPGNVALLRYLVASLALVIFAVVKKMPFPHTKDLPIVGLLGLTGFTIYNVALNYGETIVPAGTASLVVASAPIFVALLAVLFSHERLSPVAWLGILLSFGGIAVISIKPEEGLQISPNILIILICAICTAIFTVVQKPVLKRYTALQLTSYSIWAGTIFMLIFLPGLIIQMKTASLESNLAVVYMGIFPGVIGYGCWSYVLSRMPASRAGSFLYLTPVVAMFIAWFWLGEIPTFATLMGGVLVIAGVVIVNLLKNR